MILLAALAAALVSPPARSLDLDECRISVSDAFPSIKARCGMLERPLDPSDPESPTIDIRVAVVPALNLEPEADPIVPIAGGPGQGSVEFYSAYAAAFEEVRRNRDILLVDQRGTGGSARLDCDVDDELVDGLFSIEETKQAVTECLDTLPHDPRFFTTSVAVTDLEAARTALGYPALNLYGVSYGTRVAQHFARRYPDATRTITLDGVVPPQISIGPEIATEAQKAVQNIIDRCAEEPACNERFPELSAQFERLTRTLDESPARVQLAHPVTGKAEVVRFGRQEFASAVRLLAYQPSSIAMIPLLVAEAADGNLQPIAAQFKMTMDGLSEALALGMHNAVMCTEDTPFYTPAMIDRDLLETTYMGPLQIDALEAICSVWPAGPIDEDFKAPLATDIPTLLLSGTADPITPPRYADMAAHSLRKAWLLTGEQQGHGQIAVGCMPRIVARFISNAGLDDVDTSCMQSSFVMPFFLDFSGPAP
ncbi:MAG: alpha/beta hydrolase [Woeseiaceae bacterium]|nr:alpha/beta hydrolase [Woeseiaceae bacterium]